LKEGFGNQGGGGFGEPVRGDGKLQGGKPPPRHWRKPGPTLGWGKMEDKMEMVVGHYMWEDPINKRIQRVGKRKIRR